jgi:hypothetical protein
VPTNKSPQLMRGPLDGGSQIERSDGQFQGRRHHARSGVAAHLTLRWARLPCSPLSFLYFQC